MNWLQVKLQVPQTESEQLEDLLLEQGALAVTFEDAGDQPLYEPPPGETPLWQALVLTGLFPADIPSNDLLDQLRARYPGDFPAP